MPPVLDFAASYSWRFLLVAAAVVVAGYVLVRLSTVVFPVLVALLITALLHPLVAWLKRRRVPGALASALVLVGAVAALLALLALIGPAAASQFDDLAAGVRNGLVQGAELVTSGPFGVTEEDLQRRIGEAEQQIRENIYGLAGRVVSGALIAVNLLAGTVLVLFMVFFFLKDGEQMGDWAARLARNHWQEDVRELGRRSFRVLSTYARGVVIVALVDALLIALALILIGVPLVLPLAVVTFFGGFFPLVGAFVAGALSVLVALVTGGVSDAALVLLAVLAVQQIEGNVLYPLLVGSSLKLHPVATLLCVSAGTVLAGVVGALFAVPVAAVAVACSSYLRERAPGAEDVPEAPPPVPAVSAPLNP